MKLRDSRPAARPTAQRMHQLPANEANGAAAQCGRLARRLQHELRAPGEAWAGSAPCCACAPAAGTAGWTAPPPQTRQTRTSASPGCRRSRGRKRTPAGTAPADRGRKGGVGGLGVGAARGGRRGQQAHRVQQHPRNWAYQAPAATPVGKAGIGGAPARPPRPPHPRVRSPAQTPPAREAKGAWPPASSIPSAMLPAWAPALLAGTPSREHLASVEPGHTAAVTCRCSSIGAVVGATMPC